MRVKKFKREQGRHEQHCCDAPTQDRFHIILVTHYLNHSPQAENSTQFKK